MHSVQHHNTEKTGLPTTSASNLTDFLLHMHWLNIFKSEFSGHLISSDNFVGSRSVGTPLDIPVIRGLKAFNSKNTYLARCQLRLQRQK